MKAMPVSVHHEWGTLREVIVGIGDDLTMPGYCESIFFSLGIDQALTTAWFRRMAQGREPDLLPESAVMIDIDGQ
jgi:hypothetical protein